MFEKILIANRGEVALRVIRACRELGVRTVAVYSEADRDSLHVRFSDEDICIGAPPARDSYLNIPRILAEAEITGADAIHPGYGFLAENAEFAEICERSGLVFIGPTADQIRKMGNKAEARRTMDAAGVPIVPGSDGPVDDEEEAVEEARRIGFPVIIKASSGGGGKGMRLGEDEEGLRRAFVMARNEAKAAFDDPTVYVEKYISRPRHVEFQVMGDKHGNIVHYGERDCSVQRRHQKLVEESPSPALDTELRGEMGDAAVLAAASIDYSNAGTVEFLLDEDRSFFSRNRFGSQPARSSRCGSPRPSAATPSSAGSTRKTRRTASVRHLGRSPPSTRPAVRGFGSIRTSTPDITFPPITIL